MLYVNNHWKGRPKQPLSSNEWTPPKHDFDLTHSPRLGHTLLQSDSYSQDEEGETEEGEGSYRSRTYRLERTYGVSSGKWYYECEVLTEGSFKVGWQTVDTLPGTKQHGSVDNTSDTFIAFHA